MYILGRTYSWTIRRYMVCKVLRLVYGHKKFNESEKMKFHDS